MHPIGPLLTHWSVRLALVCYVAVLAGEIVRPVGEGWLRRLRWLWTVGCVAFITHFAVAMHFYHGWSQSHVLAHTAKRTDEMIGWAFGEGIYFSYLFTVVWTVDCLWWWARPAGYRARPRWLRLGIHGYLLFIAVNGAMVFEGGATRWGGVVSGIGLLGLWLWRRHLTRPRPDEPGSAVRKP